MADVVGFSRFVEIRERHRARAVARPRAGRVVVPEAPPPVTIEGEVVLPVPPEPEPDTDATAPGGPPRRGPARRGQPWGPDAHSPFPARP